MARFTWIIVLAFVMSFAGTAEAQKGAHKGHSASGPFSDVPMGHWAYDAVSKSAESGILQGWNNRFWGDKTVTRYQMAVVVARMLDRVGVLRSNGKVITAQDIANLESLTIEFADELALLNVKVSTLEDTVASLKKDVDAIKADMRGVGARAGIWGTVSTRFAFTDDGAPGYGQIGGGSGNSTLGNGHERRFDDPTGAAQPTSAGTAPLVRYRGALTGPQNADAAGNPAGTAANPYRYEERDFFSVSQFSLNFDREFDPGFHFHAQVDINAEGGDLLSFFGGNQAAGTVGGFGAVAGTGGMANGLFGNGVGGFFGAVGPGAFAGTHHDGLLAWTGAPGQNLLATRMASAVTQTAAPTAAGSPTNTRIAQAPFQFDDGRGHTFSDGNIQINEVYVVWDDWLGEVEGRMGVWALPMNTEVNGPSRTYQWTITPSITNSKWESIRVAGIDLFENDDKQELWWYAGLFTSNTLTNGVARAGTLLAGPTGDDFSLGLTGAALGPAGGPFTGGGVALGAASALLTDGVARAGDGLSGRFMNSLASTMTDAPRGYSGPSDDDTIGWYVLIGTHPTNKNKEGLRWHAAYYDNNGDITGSSSTNVTTADWEAFQLSADYQWKDLMVMGQYYTASSANSSRADFASSAFGGAFVDANGNGIDDRTEGKDSRTAVTPFMNDGRSDTDSDAYMFMVNWAFSKKGSVTARYEGAKDKTGLANLEADVLTLGFNWQTSDHSWFQAEYISPETEATSENGVTNSLDQNDDLWQFNYKLTF